MQTEVNETLEAATLEHVAMSAGGEAEAPTRILLSPWGEVRSSTGSFVMDDAAASAVIAAFEAHGTDVPIDYEHQTLGGAYSSPTGQAPAAGWIKRIFAVRPQDAAQGERPGLWAEVEWTAESARQLVARQYRYLSPVALVRKSDRRVVALHSAALTNKPAIVGMAPVVASEPPVEAMRRMLALDESATEDLVLVTAVQRLTALEEGAAQQRAGQRVAEAMAAGKLTPAQRDWAMALALRDPSEFDRWEAAAPAVVVVGKTQPPSRPSTSPGQRAVEIAARAEWEANRAFLGSLCTQEAYVADALRTAV